MKKSFVCIATLGLALVSTSAFANDMPHEDAASVHAQTVSKKSVNYRCQSGKKVTVTYGFNKQNLPTYAQATLNGKSRFMPVNLSRTDSTGTVFGDENNFSLSTGPRMTGKNYRSISMMVTSPSSEILFKSCKAGK